MSISVAHPDQILPRSAAAPRFAARRTFREILVHCSAPENWARALDYALLLARPGEAHITRFHPLADVEALDADDTAEWAETHAFPTAGTIANYAAWADLIVRDHPGTAANLYDWVVGSGRPCVVLPAAEHGVAPPRRIAIGWNGSLEAARSLHAALPLLRAADEVVLCDSTLYRRDVRSAGMDVGTYLSMQGIAAERVDTNAATSAPAAAAAMAAAAERNADLLVLGAFRERRFEGWDAGETLLHALRACDVPLFLAH